MTTRLPADLLEPTIYSSLRAQAEFHIVTNSVSNRLLSAPTMSTGEALAANQALESWTTKLPPYLRVDQPNLYSHSWHSFARAKLWWRYWNLQIILFRPFLMRCANKEAKNDTGDVITPEEDHSRDICLSAAHLTINSIEEYMGQNAPSRLAAWYALWVETGQTSAKQAANIVSDISSFTQHWCLASGSALNQNLLMRPHGKPISTRRVESFSTRSEETF